MKTKHTPGPWYIDPFKGKANGNIRVMAEQCTPVCVVPDHLRVDARLIAAAPDLLEALKVLQIWCGLDEKSDVWINSGARDAISKATGERA